MLSSPAINTWRFLLHCFTVRTWQNFWRKNPGNVGPQRVYANYPSPHSASNNSSKLSFKRSHQNVVLVIFAPDKPISAVSPSRFQGSSLPCDPISLMNLRKVLGFQYAQLLSYFKDRSDDFQAFT